MNVTSKLLSKWILEHDIVVRYYLRVLENGWLQNVPFDSEFTACCTIWFGLVDREIEGELLQRRVAKVVLNWKRSCGSSVTQQAIFELDDSWVAIFNVEEHCLMLFLFGQIDFRSCMSSQTCRSVRVLRPHKNLSPRKFTPEKCKRLSALHVF